MIGKKILAHQEALHKSIEKRLIPLLDTPYSQLDGWLEKYIAETQKFYTRTQKHLQKKDSIRVLHEHIVFRKSMLKLLDLWIHEKEKVLPALVLADYSQDVRELLLHTDVWWVQQQSSQRFSVQPGDSLRVKLVKFLKRTGYFFYSLPVRTVNVFRKIFKRPLRHPKPWKQKIPVHKLTRWYYENLLLERFTPLMDQVLKNTAILAAEAWNADHELYEDFAARAQEKSFQNTLAGHWEKQCLPNLRRIQQKIRKCINDARDELQNVAMHVDNAFENQVQLAGTLESLPLYEYQRKRNRKKLAQEYAQRYNRRVNTLFVLSDDWKFNQEVYVLKDSAVKAQWQLEARINTRQENVCQALEAIPGFLQKLFDNIVLSDTKDFLKLLQQLKTTAIKNFRESVIPKTAGLLIEQDIPFVIEESEQLLTAELATMNQKRILIAGFDPAKDYGSSALQYIWPAELVEFELLKKIRKVVLQLKTDGIQKLEKLNTDLENMGRMVVFNLDASIAMLQQEGEEGLETSYQDARSAMQRALQNYHELHEFFSHFMQHLKGEFEKSVKIYSSELSALTDNSRVTEIQYRITRAKAMKKSEQLATLIASFGKKWVSKVQVTLRFVRNKTDAGIAAIKGQLGIQHLPGEITSEISDFLVSGDAALKKLPFVYRRLFVNEPLKENTFYLTRVQAQQELDTAFEKWKAGSFTPVLIKGEKGSGISTFVQMFVKEKMQRQPIVYSVPIQKRLFTEEELLAILGHAFRGKAFATTQELYEYADNQEPFVAYLDKLHLMYLRQPGGFLLLKKFFEIISATSRKIFWLCTCGLYASVYLNNSVGLYDYFPVVITMKNLSMEEVSKMIMLRHKASGYNLHFKPSASDLTERSYLKKNEKEKQEYLQQKYFLHLNKLTLSNIAFALQLWLRSTDRVENNTIYINSLENIDFGFIRNLPSEVVFGLHALLLHENLDVFQLSQVLNISKRQAYLMLMRLADRGVVTESRGLYAIHTLLYRQAVGLLKDKNLIH